MYSPLFCSLSFVLDLDAAVAKSRHSTLAGQAFDGIYIGFSY